MLLRLGIQLDCFFNSFLWGFSSIGDDLSCPFFQSFKFLAVFSFLGHLKYRIDSSWYWDEILIFVESVELLLLFPYAVMICDVFCAMIIKQIGLIDWINVVWPLMKASERALCGCLSLVEHCKAYGSKRVILLKLLGTVVVFIVFVISLYLCCSPLSAYSRIILKVK